VRTRIPTDNPRRQALRQRVVVRLRALIILPTRELVAQVAEVFKPFCVATGLRLGTATGQTSFAQEQHRLVPDLPHRCVQVKRRQRPHGCSANSWRAGTKIAVHVSSVAGGASAVDILVTTPGRLMDHLTGTPNFTLQHLRYLVCSLAHSCVAPGNHNDDRTRVLSTIALVASIGGGRGRPFAESVIPGVAGQGAASSRACAGLGHGGSPGSGFDCRRHAAGRRGPALPPGSAHRRRRHPCAGTMPHASIPVTSAAEPLMR